MLIAGALGLLTLVVVGIVGLLALDLGRRENRHWLDALKTWQQLIGSVLGFLGAAGVLVLSTAIQQNNDQLKAENVAYAIGRGLAFEVENMGIGLKIGHYIGSTIDFTSPTIDHTCQQYAQLLQRTLVPEAPVYNAVLPRMVDFGETNLQWFARFYALYANILRELPEEIANGCTLAPASELEGMVAQVRNAIGLYAQIAMIYGIQPIDSGLPAADATTSPGSSSEPVG